MTSALAPYESCMSCYKGDTSTAVAFTGSPEYVVASLMVTVGVEEPIAMQLVHDHYNGLPFVVRLCSECAEKTAGLTVRPLNGGIPNYDEETQRRYWEQQDHQRGDAQTDHM
jgi:hypothetical protein